MDMDLTMGAFLIGIGLLLLVIDLVIASGVLLVLALTSLVVGMTFLFRYDTWVGMYTLLGLLLVLPALAGLAVRLWPYTPLGKLMQQPPDDPSADSLLINRELQALKGQHGKTLTALRPAGMVEFEGRRVDSLTEGMMVEAGRWVRCVDVRGNTVIVRPVDRPETFDLETAAFH